MQQGGSGCQARVLPAGCDRQQLNRLQLSRDFALAHAEPFWCAGGCEPGPQIGEPAGCEARRGGCAPSAQNLRLWLLQGGAWQRYIVGTAHVPHCCPSQRNGAGVSPLLEAFNSGFLQGIPGSIKSLSACLCTAAAHDTACSGSLSAAQLLWVVHKSQRQQQSLQLPLQHGPRFEGWRCSAPPLTAEGQSRAVFV